MSHQSRYLTEGLTVRVLAAIHTWSTARDLQPMITLHPAGTPDDQLPTGTVVEGPPPARHRLPADVTGPDPAGHPGEHAGNNDTAGVDLVVPTGHPHTRLIIIRGTAAPGSPRSPAPSASSAARASPWWSRTTSAGSCSTSATSTGQRRRISSTGRPPTLADSRDRRPILGVDDTERSRRRSPEGQ